MFEQHKSTFETRDSSIPGVEVGIDQGFNQERAQGFQLPAKLWVAMFACYGAFISLLAIATGGSGEARMVLAISALFMLVYFVTASILASLGGADRQTMSRSRPLQSLYGPMNARDVWIQVLSIPLALVLFGTGIVVVISVVAQ